VVDETVLSSVIALLLLALLMPLNDLGLVEYKDGDGDEGDGDVTFDLLAFTPDGFPILLGALNPVVFDGFLIPLPVIVPFELVLAADLVDPLDIVSNNSSGSATDDAWDEVGDIGVNGDMP